MRPEAKREAAQYLLQDYSVSRSRACLVLRLNRSTFDYGPKVFSSEEVRLRDRMRELARDNRRYGLPRIHYLLKREKLVSNKKRTERIYREEKLQLKHRKRKKLGSVIRIARPRASFPNEVWSMDFVHDRRESGRSLRMLTIVDDLTKESPGILVASSISGVDATEFLDSLAVLPRRFRLDNGTEWTSRAFLDWAYTRGIEIEFIRPGKPTENAYIESFNSRLRDECLNEHVFFSLEDAHMKINSWRRKYNEERPHSSLGMKTPKEFAEELKAVLLAN